MKRFFQSFLGSMAAIWLSFLLLFVGLFVMIIAVSVSSASKSGKIIEIKKGSILLVDLSKDISDRQVPVDILTELQYGTSETLALNNAVMAIDAAADDDRIDGIFIDAAGGSAGLAQSYELMNAINRFKEKDKWVYAYSDNYTQGNYVISTVADSIFLNPVGAVDIHGLQSTSLYFKEMLDRLGIDVQVVKVGTYKSAVEPFLLNDMSEPARQQQEVYLGNIWKSLADRMAKSRRLTVDRINRIADSIPAFRPADFLLKQKLVDKLVYRHEFEDMLKELTDHDELETISTDDYCAVNNVEKIGGGGDVKIGILYAVGDITEDGEDGIASSTLVPQILELAEDDEIDGLILRVNSGGGSAFASEQIWEALEQYKKLTKKPFYVSMGDVAASGGYYISCGADRIYAQPVTLTGSIGIFGMIPSAKTLFNEKLGINTATVSTNPSGQLPTLFEPMTPTMLASMQSYVNNGYELFTSRVASGRKISQDSVKVIGEGRVWDGAMAQKIGLVDKLGGLDVAIRDMATQFGATSYTLEEYPSLKLKWWQQLMSLDSEISEHMTRNSLGEAYPLYRAVERIKRMSVLQCRMTEYIIIN